MKSFQNVNCSYDPLSASTPCVCYAYFLFSNSRKITNVFPAKNIFPDLPCVASCAFFFFYARRREYVRFAFGQSQIQ